MTPMNLTAKPPMRIGTIAGSWNASARRRASDCAMNTSTGATISAFATFVLPVTAMSTSTPTVAPATAVAVPVHFGVW